MNDRANEQITLPLPPIEMRRLVGPTEPSFFDNPQRQPIFDIPVSHFRNVVDFGCGCGRNARRLIQQIPKPEAYLGFDLHAGMVNWCQKSLSTFAPEFTFVHHDVANPGFNPGLEKPAFREMPAYSETASLIIAWSVFTHTLQEPAVHYLKECARVLAPDGIVIATFFIFEKRYFPMMQEFQNALYINTNDPSNAVIFDRDWLQKQFSDAGLIVNKAVAPEIRGFQWTLHLKHSGCGETSVILPEDRAPFGRKPPPLLQAGADKIGSD